MANGYSVVPIDGSKLANDSLAYLDGELLYVPETLPAGRFPTLSELRKVIQGFGYTLEETNDWYVTSSDDYTEIWFSGNVRAEDQPSAFWFRRGGTIVFDIMQALANTCGSCIVADHTGAPSILILPDTVFENTGQRQTQTGFVDVITQRLPIIIERLSSSNLNDTLFLLSQIRQPLKWLHDLYPHALHLLAQQGMSAYIALLKHEDVRVRYLAFDLITTFHSVSIEETSSLGDAIATELYPDTKAQMIWAIEAQVAGSSNSPSGIPPWTQHLIEILQTVSEKTNEALPVRFAATNIVVRALAGYWTPKIRDIMIEALTQPESYRASWDSLYNVNQQALETIKLFQLQQRTEILRTALPKIQYAQDAHQILRALLDNVFFGAERTSWMSSLPPDRIAERPPVDTTRFRDYESQDWLYPVQAAKLNAIDLLPFQREILAEVLEYDVPWMVHSNLLEKYGLPATRAEVRSLLRGA